MSKFKKGLWYQYTNNPLININFMTNKIMTILMVVFAVVLYTMAVVDFMSGQPLDAVCNVLFACSDLAVAYMLIRMERQRKAFIAMFKLLFDFVEQLKKGVPVTLTISKGDDDEEEEIPEDELTDDEKRIKRMAVEYDLLTERLERLTAFRATDTYKQLPEDSRSLIDKSCKAMEDDQAHLKRSIELECDNMNKNQAQD